MQLPQYLSHKLVGALKIGSVQWPKGVAIATDVGAVLVPEKAEYEPLKVSNVYVSRHNPTAGGYYVQYADGLESFSPAEAFEAGYRPLSGLALTFSDALNLLRTGKRVTRGEWVSRMMWVTYQKGYPNGVPINANTAESTGLVVGDKCSFRPYLMMCNEHGSFVPWTPNMMDLLAGDWQIAEAAADSNQAANFHNPEITYYGPAACFTCGAMIVKGSAAQGFGDIVLDYPAKGTGPIYPNYTWAAHVCRAR